MNNRLLEIIRYKTGGKQTEFASLMGWTPQYLSKLLRGENFGITPLVTILERLPEISARWLLLGNGEMLEIGKLFTLQREAFAQVQAILELEKYIPVMSSRGNPRIRTGGYGGEEARFPARDARKVAGTVKHTSDRIGGEIRRRKR
nr:hypothetical protein [Bacteroides intestinalis]